MKSQSKVKSLLLILAACLVIGIANPALSDQVILAPNAPGDLTQLGPNPVYDPPVPNWQYVLTDDGDTSFVGTASVIWLTDLYSLENAATSGTINWVRVYVEARTNGTATQQSLTTALRTDAVTFYGTGVLLTTSYTEYYTQYSQNPDTLADWTWDEIDALQAGVQLTRSQTGGGPKESRCTLVWVVVDYTPSDYEGLSHGYWKNHLSDWAATGYSTLDTLESVFDIPDVFGLDDSTLLQALDFGGGPTLADKAKILLRNAVASLLNAAHPNIDYPLTLAEVIADVNAALASGDATTMLALEAVLDGYNNLGGDISS